jgi:hypothetical protein
VTKRMFMTAAVLFCMTAVSEAGPIRNAIANWRASRGQACERTESVGQANGSATYTPAAPSTTTAPPPRFLPFFRTDPTNRLTFRVLETCSGLGCK